MKQCDHKKGLAMLGEVTTPLEDGHHTKFMVLGCQCGELMGFPDSNYELAQKEGTPEAKEGLAGLAAKYRDKVTP